LSSRGSDVFQSWILEDMMAFLRLVRSPEEPLVQDVIRLMNKPNRYINYDVMARVKEALPERSADVWNMLMSHSELSTAKQRRVREFYHALCAYNEGHRRASDHVKLESMLEDQVFDYKHYLTQDQAHGDEARAEIHIRRFRLYQTLAHSDDFLLRVERIRNAVRRAAVGKRNEPPEGLVLTTFHTAKGLEWPHVWIIDAVDGLVPSAAIEADDSVGDMEEERRLFYVACTRTIESLTISAPRNLAGESTVLSPFVTESGLAVDKEKQAKSRQKGGLLSRALRRLTQGNLGGQRKKTKPENPEHTIREPLQSVDELQPGTELLHRMWGHIIVEAVNTGKGVLWVRTQEGEKKRLSVRTCLENGLLGQPGS
jgi:DNA helicase-2/ATP-dependent DNA helicase PcrA